MNGRHWALGMLATLSVLMTGCAATSATTQPAHGVSTSAMPAMSPGMAMPPGMTMPGNGTADSPSASAQMVCGPEIQADIATILTLRTAPATTATWADHLYTCTYHLADGPLVLSVKESSDVPAATAYFTTLREHLGTTQPLVGLAGLGNPGYDTGQGTVVVLKDDKTLQVNATGLPNRVGQHEQSRADLAYEVATDILGCWTGK